MNFVLSSLSEGLLWSIMAIGVYLTFRILDIADMTALKPTTIVPVPEVTSENPSFWENKEPHRAIKPFEIM